MLMHRGVHWTSYCLQGTRYTLQCITGHPVFTWTWRQPGFQKSTTNVLFTVSSHCFRSIKQVDKIFCTWEVDLQPIKQPYKSSSIIKLCMYINICNDWRSGFHMQKSLSTCFLDRKTMWETQFISPARSWLDGPSSKHDYLAKAKCMLYATYKCSIERTFVLHKTVMFLGSPCKVVITFQVRVARDIRLMLVSGK